MLILRINSLTHKYTVRVKFGGFVILRRWHIIFSLCYESLKVGRK
jgi:hypothetical protein